MSVSTRVEYHINGLNFSIILKIDNNDYSNKKDDLTKWYLHSNIVVLTTKSENVIRYGTTTNLSDSLNKDNIDDFASKVVRSLDIDYNTDEVQKIIEGFVLKNYVYKVLFLDKIYDECEFHEYETTNNGYIYKVKMYPYNLNHQNYFHVVIESNSISKPIEFELKSTREDYKNAVDMLIAIKELCGFNPDINQINSIISVFRDCYNYNEFKVID